MQKLFPVEAGIVNRWLH